MLDVCRWLFHDNWEVVAGHTRRARRRCTQVVGRDHVQECPRCSLVTSLRAEQGARVCGSFVCIGGSLLGFVGGAYWHGGSYLEESFVRCVKLAWYLRRQRRDSCVYNFRWRCHGEHACYHAADRWVCADNTCIRGCDCQVLAIAPCGLDAGGGHGILRHASLPCLPFE